MLDDAEALATSAITTKLVIPNDHVRYIVLPPLLGDRSDQKQAVETALEGAKAADAATIEQSRHMAPLAPIDDVRGSAAYRVDAAAELVRRAISAAAANHSSCMGVAA